MFTFVSTLGVNWPFTGPGKIQKEKMYRLEDIEPSHLQTFVKEIMAMSEKKANDKTEAITKRFNVNYMLSKNWAEHALN